jgi:hypothetical protein
MQETNPSVEADSNLVRDVATTGIQHGGYAEAVARLLLNYAERIERLEAQIRG